MGRASKRRFVGAVAACVVIMAFIRLTPNTEKAARQALHRHNPLRPIGATAAERLKARRRSPRNPNHLNLSADMPGWGDAGVGDPNVGVEKQPPPPPPPPTTRAMVARRPRPPAMAAPVVDDGADNAVVELRLKDDRVQGTIRIRLTPELSGPRSAAYLQKLATVDGGLKRDHNIFRSEPTLLLQGRLCVHWDPIPAPIPPSLSAVSPHPRRRLQLLVSLTNQPTNQPTVFGTCGGALSLCPPALSALLPMSGHGLSLFVVHLLVFLLF